MENIYYIITEEQKHLSDCEDVVENSEDLTPFPNGNYVIKTRIGIVNCEELSGVTSYTHEEILTELSKAEYQSLEI